MFRTGVDPISWLVRLGVILILMVFFVVPLVWLVTATTKTNRQILDLPPLAIGALSYIPKAWGYLMQFLNGVLARWIFNSFSYVIQGLVLSISIAVPAGFVLAVIPFRLRQPLLWLIVQAVVLVVALWGTGRLHPVRQPDTATYENVDWSSAPAVWSGIRTPGYPLFLAFADRLAPAHGAVPILQLAALILGAWVLYFGLRACGYRDWIALACAST